MNKVLFKKVLCSIAVCAVSFVFIPAALKAKVFAAGETPGSVVTSGQSAVEHYTSEQALKDFSDSGAKGYVKQYIKFLQDPTYMPSNNLTEISDQLANAQTFVNKDFTLKPSLFPTLENVTSSLLKQDGGTLWLGYKDGGVDRVNLSDNSVHSFTAEMLGNERVLLLVDDTDGKGVWVIARNDNAVVVEHIN